VADAEAQAAAAAEDVPQPVAPDAVEDVPWADAGAA